jgi:hypothetical protein
MANFSFCGGKNARLPLWTQAMYQPGGGLAAMQAVIGNPLF